VFQDTRTLPAAVISVVKNRATLTIAGRNLPQVHVREKLLGDDAPEHG
jgi:hypothetical protein